MNGLINRNKFPKIYYLVSMENYEHKPKASVK